MQLPVEIDFGRMFSGAAPLEWEEEYRRCVSVSVEAVECSKLGRKEGPLIVPAGDIRPQQLDSPFDVLPSIWPSEIFDDRF